MAIRDSRSSTSPRAPRWLLERAQAALGLAPDVEVTLRQYACPDCGARDQTAEVSLRRASGDMAKARRSVLAFVARADAAASAARHALQSLEADTAACPGGAKRG